ncbi:DMT family transporter [Deinococcus peraridilitoris]|nr:DMT family transporter [Deinococcus peraridilitoris]
MSHPLTLSTALLLVVPPLLWASNAIVGRLVIDLVPPITLNFLRWTIALFILLPFASSIYRRGSGLLTHWRRYAVLGLLGVGMYNALQYLALRTSSPINVTLVAASMPVWMLGVGSMFFGVHVTLRQVIGAVLSILGVLFVLSRGDWEGLLALRLVPGDLFMLLATVAWSVYSWLLTRGQDEAAIRATWATFLLAQVSFGVVWSGVFAAGEWAWSDVQITWNAPLALALLYVATFPSLVAFRAWGIGVQRVGPNVAAFFNNLTPLFAALMSLAVLGERAHLYHVTAFALIVGGIAVSARR